jgi:uncharacterized protein (TIGR03083 family)
MTSLADRTIASLRAEHSALATSSARLTDAELVAPSGATAWAVADVLSHLGSGAVITGAGLQVALGSRDALEDGFNQSVWDTWNAMNPAEQRAGFLERDEELVAAFEALDKQQRDSLRLQVGFRPEPVSVAMFAGMRLNEVAHHSWDVRVARDSAAGLLPDTASVLAEQFSTELAFLLGFIGKADQVADPVRLEIAGSGYQLTIDESVSLAKPSGDVTAYFTGPLEAVIRMIAGRLGPTHTPGEVAVTGSVTLDELRKVFPGY